MGIATLHEAKTKARAPLAAMPLIFGAQQAVEGVVWMTAGIPWFQSMAAFLYVMFSHLLWPAYIPFAVGAIETSVRRKRVLNVFLFIGVSMSVWFAAYVARGPVTASIASGCVVYRMILPPIPYGLAAYVLVTCVSCLISSHKFIRVMGIALIGALAISMYAYLEAFYSVWCFFSAILSAIIYVQLRPDWKLWPAAVAKKISRSLRS